MRARVDLSTDPISLKVIAHDGLESKFMDDNNGKIVDIFASENGEQPANSAALQKKVEGHSILGGFSCVW